MKTVYFIIQVLFAIALAPLVSGLMRKIKNTLRMRKGASVLQPYYNLRKYFGKEEVVSVHTSVLSRLAPYVVLSSTVTAFLFVPVFHYPHFFPVMGGVLAMLFFLALGRFFLVLAGLDAGSSFGGMGSSREMFISSLAEPVAICALAVVALKSGALHLPAALYLLKTPVSVLIAAAALLLVVIAETSRIPVDNQETHLELTMIHEAMLLEFSGRSLALMELSAQVKQMLLFSVLACILWPFPITVYPDAGWYCLSAVSFVVKVLLIAGLVSLVEVVLAKMRLFRVVDYMGFAFLLAVLALIMAGMGV